MDAPGRVVTIFGSSSPKPGDEDYEQARDLGSGLARAGCVICNGGYGGTMEASARGAREAGGKTIGVICSEFGTRPANPWISESVVTHTLVERLMKLITLGDAYVVLRGGTGTLLEFAAVWELVNKKLMTQKPVLVFGAYWDGVISTISEQLRREGAGPAPHQITRVSSTAECIESLESAFRINH